MAETLRLIVHRNSLSAADAAGTPHELVFDAAPSSLRAVTAMIRERCRELPFVSTGARTRYLNVRDVLQGGESLPEHSNHCSLEILRAGGQTGRPLALLYWRLPRFLVDARADVRAYLSSAEPPHLYLECCYPANPEAVWQALLHHTELPAGIHGEPIPPDPRSFLVQRDSVCAGMT